MTMKLYQILSNILFIALITSCATMNTAPRANEALGKLAEGDPKQAWQMISVERANPTITSKEDLCELNIATLKILFNIVNNDYAPSDPDSIAKESYDYGTENCRNLPAKHGTVESLYGTYLIVTKRPGLSIPHTKKAMQFYPEISYNRMIDENNIAVAYADMGQLKLRDVHMLRAINIGKEHFRKQRHYKYNLDEAVEFMEYKGILERRMNHLSTASDDGGVLPEMYDLWGEIETINTRWVSKPTQYVAYRYAAQLFSSAGDIAFAYSLMDEAKKLSVKYPQKNKKMTDLDLLSANAKILNDEGRHEAAARLYTYWITNFTKIYGKQISGNDYRLAGLAQESAGNYDLAIDYLEKAINEFEVRRSSFKASSRGRFFSGLMSTTYWGLIRSYAVRYLKYGNEQDFQEAIRFEQMLRARQFGELLNIDDFRQTDINYLASKLELDELLIDYILTDKAIVLFALSSDQRELFVVPYESKKLNETLRRLKTNLSSPIGHDVNIEDIQDISNLVLGPVKDILLRSNKLIIIPDGYLNGIPFTILSVRSDSYVPVILNHEVVVTPSISFFMHQRTTKRNIATKSLFALADPAYETRSLPETYTDEARQLYTRAVNSFNLFSPLPETRIEVKKIANAFHGEDVTFLLGKNATESNLKSLSLDKYGYLHFATHGVLGNQIPGLYEPALVLATEQTEQDGFLTLSEVEHLNLNCQLTVLSACDTGSGEYYTGEGIMGLSRGFLLAGSNSVLVSLWPVDSIPTVEFMDRFYTYLGEGKTKTESLRLTQIEMMYKEDVVIKEGKRGIKISQKGGKRIDLIHSFFWATFILIGE